MTVTGGSPAHAGESAWHTQPPHRQEALQIEYCTPGQLRDPDPTGWQDVLGIVLYGEERGQLAAPAQIPVAAVASAPLGAAAACVELWRLRATCSGDALRSGRHGPIHYRYGGGLLFATRTAPEAAAIATAGTAATVAAAAAPTLRGPALQRTTRLAYGDLFRTLEHVGFAHPVRLWNYLPDLNAHCDGAQCYAHFNAGRQDAFLESRRRLAGQVPAASVLGVRAGAPLTLYCLAAREPPLPLENPRQCSAWAYPRHYSERRPTFARACIDRSGSMRLFISGTASIVGHRSEHPGDPVAQTRETLRNIRALLGAANERVGASRFSEQALAYKVYIRDRRDHGAITQILREELGAGPPRLFLQAEVCRPELLVEIEATSV